ncbi:hypothetical protein ACE41A_14215 [Bacillus cytotoxicus]|uniref:hypothetical protein n=1 Tax=Bacillus cytotoxicus TaxID=580165 RepID=UPI0035CA4F82
MKIGKLKSFFLDFNEEEWERVRVLANEKERFGMEKAIQKAFGNENEFKTSFELLEEFLQGQINQNGVEEGQKKGFYNILDDKQTKRGASMKP